MARSKGYKKRAEEEVKPGRNGLVPAYGRTGDNPYVIYCDWRREETDIPKVLILNFKAKYAAKFFLDQVMGSSEYKWVKPVGSRECIKLESGIRVSMFGKDLQMLIDYDRTIAEEEWVDDQIVRYVQNFKYGRSSEEKASDHKNISGEDDRPGVRETSGKKHKQEKIKKEPKTKIDKTGMITANDIAKELGVEGREVRGVLRAMKLEKPEGGWMFDKKTAEEIREKVKKGLKEKAKKK